MIGRFVGIGRFPDDLAVPVKDPKAPLSKSKEDDMLPLQDDIGFGKDEIDNEHNISLLIVFETWNPSFFTQMTSSFTETISRPMGLKKMI